MTDWIAAEVAVARLGVRPQTLYAYVSRGRIETRPDPTDPRRSLYRAADVAGLADRKARGRKAADVAAGAIAFGEPVLASAITTISGGRLYYRGRDAALLSETETLESTAERLWGVAIPARAAVERPPPPAGRDVLARAFLTLAIRAGVDPPALRRTPGALAVEGADLLGLVADAAAGVAGREPIHLRLAAAWGADAAGADLIRRALVLLADHELNPSTFAARVAASTGASLAASALAGLAALSGPRHGGASTAMGHFAVEAAQLGVKGAVAQRLAEDRGLPGFGHPLYPGGDPRAAALLARFTPSPALASLRDAVEHATGRGANIDFALAAMADALGLPAQAPFALFATARTAGWIAHAIEQGQGGGVIRPRARYIGVAVEQ